MPVYVVTGGAGFIGSHLVDALTAAGHAVLVVDNLSTGSLANLPPGLQCLVGDVGDPTLMRHAMAGADGCFHLAAVASIARSEMDRLGAHRTNQGGTVAVLEAASDAGRVPVVYASSAAIYGDQGAIRLHEALVPRPTSAYGVDKLGSELHARIASLVHATPTVGLRFFNVYGPRQSPHSPYSGVISIFANRLCARRSLPIKGDGLQTRDFIYVSDVVGHLLAAMARATGCRTPQPELFNVCSGFGTSILGLAEAFGEVVGWVPEVTFQSAGTGDVRASLGNPRAARAALATGAPMSLSEGLARLYRSLDAQRIASAIPGSALAIALGSGPGRGQQPAPGMPNAAIRLVHSGDGRPA